MPSKNKTTKLVIFAALEGQRNKYDQWAVGYAHGKPWFKGYQN
jgi:hypothetical protein